MNIIFYIIISALTGAFLTWLVMRNMLKQRLLMQAGQVGQLELYARELKEENKALHSGKEAYISRSAALAAQVESLTEKLATQKESLIKESENLRTEFRNMAQTILDEKTEKFTRLNEEKMKAILDPLKTEIGQFKEKVEKTYDTESKERFSLGNEVKRLIEMTQTISQEANNLTSALKGNSKFQGDWGEMILESLLQNSGLTAGREYFLQEFIRDNAGNVVKDENGKALQPDVTICYPDQRKLIIDSKVSLVAWDAFVSEANADERNNCLKQHIGSIRAHIDGLSKKNYPKYAQALDYVLLFIPIEPAFLEAVRTDVNLWKFAYDKKILLVSPTNLFAVLKIVADLWKVEVQNRNAIAIADKAGLLYDKFVGFVTNMEDVGKKITDASNSYNDAFKQLSSGRGNLVSRVEELKKMGANAQKQLPDKIMYNLDQ
jgi:DNA recombination protein RmuC